MWDKGKRVRCIWNSRRLSEVKQFIDDQLEQLQNTAKRLDYEKVEGAGWILRCLSSAVRKVMYELDKKTEWRNLVPWPMARCDIPEEACRWPTLLTLTLCL